MTSCVGSPMRPALGTFVWAWFELLVPVCRGSQAKSTEHRRLDTGEVTSRAKLARQIRVTKAHVTQILSLLSRVPEAHDMALAS